MTIQPPPPSGMYEMPDGGSTTMVIESVDFDAVVEDAELTPQGLSEQ